MGVTGMMPWTDQRSVPSFMPDERSLRQEEPYGAVMPGTRPSLPEILPTAASDASGPYGAHSQR